MTKKVLSVLLALCLVIGAVPLAALAEEPVQVSEFTLADEVDSLSNDELFAGYVDRLFFGNAGISTYADSTHNAGSRLKGDSLKLYNGLKEKIIKIAAGDIASTEITVSGVPYSEDTVNAVMDALLSDCPYELFWFDKVSGWLQGGSNGYTIVNFKVATAYSKTGNANTFETDTTKIKSVQTAVANAKKVVEDNKDKSDYEKLVAYKEYICNAVKYNTNAANGGSATVGIDPWQLIYVFDKDTNTNVVCEGYAKAFQYLCDLTTFTDPTIQCYSVSGTMHGGTGAGLHMWNIVTIGEKNYLVDVTNCDEGSVGYPDRLFLVGYSSGSVETGYVIKTGEYSYIGSDGKTWTYESTDITYVYDDDSKIFDSVLTLSDTKYVPESTPEQPTPVPTNTPDPTNTPEPTNTPAPTDTPEPTNTPDPTNTPEPTNTPDQPTPGQSDFVIDENGVLVKYKGTGGNVVIPDNVTSIGEDAFSGLTSLTSITIPNGVTSIGNYAFTGCTSLASVTIPDGVTSIGNHAFNGCTSLTSVTIPNSVTSIGNDAFFWCTKLASVTMSNSVTSIGFQAFADCFELTDITIPATVTTIADRAFEGCVKLTSVTIPASVTNIGVGPFSQCLELKSITVDPQNSNFAEIGGVLVTKDGTKLIQYPAGKEVTEYTIPDSVTSIGDWAFYCCIKLTGITIPEGVTSIGDNAFYNCSELTSITIPATVTSINGSAFSLCNALRNVHYNGTEAMWAEIAGSGNLTGDDITIEYSGIKSLELTASPTSVVIPAKGANPATVTLTATAIDIANGPVQVKNATWSVTPATTGISISAKADATNTLTVNPGIKAPTGGKVTVTVSFGGETATKDITITRASSVAASVTVTGKPSITLPKGEKTATETYTAKVSDQYGDEMKGAAVTWSLGDEYEGVAVVNGVITVSSTATSGEIVLNAASGAVTGSITITLTNAPWVNPYPDVKASDWVYKYGALEYVTENGLMSGSDGKFAGKSPLTRAQFAQILYNRAHKPPVTSKSKFKDVKGGEWFANAVIWAAENKIVNGYEDGTFRPDQMITREQLATMVWRVEKEPTAAANVLDKFPDANNVSDYAESAMAYAVKKGIVNGDQGKLNPRGITTREQTAQVLKNWLDK